MSFCAASNCANACGLFTSSGVAWMLPTFARASVAPMRTFCSCEAKPFTVLTRFGTRSARRWYWFTTSDHEAFTCSSPLCRSLYPQPAGSNTANATPKHPIVFLFLSLARLILLWGRRAAGQEVPQPRSGPFLAHQRFAHQEAVHPGGAQALDFGARAD